MFKWICAAYAVVFIIIFVWLIWLSPAFSQQSQPWLKTVDEHSRSLVPTARPWTTFSRTHTGRNISGEA